MHSQHNLIAIIAFPLLLLQGYVVSQQLETSFD